MHDCESNVPFFSTEAPQGTCLTSFWFIFYSTQSVTCRRSPMTQIIGLIMETLQTQQRLNAEFWTDASGTSSWPQGKSKDLVVGFCRPPLTLLNIPVRSLLKITRGSTWEIIWTEVATLPDSSCPKVIELWDTHEEYLWFCGGISHFLIVGLLCRQHLCPGQHGEKDDKNHIWQTGHIKHVIKKSTPDIWELTGHLQHPVGWEQTQ